MSSLRLALRFARRELRGGFAGFRIFFMCLVLGSAAIAGVESLSSAFLTGLQDQGQVLLGIDVATLDDPPPYTVTFADVDIRSL